MGFITVVLLLFLINKCYGEMHVSNNDAALVLVPHGENPDTSMNKVVIPHGNFLFYGNWF